MQDASPEALDPHTAYAAARTAARHIRPQLADARQTLETEMVITPGMEDGLAALMRAVRALYALEAVGEQGARAQVDDAMDAMGRALALVQGEISQHSGLAKAGEIIARSMAMLYPAQQSLTAAIAKQSATIASIWAETPEEAAEAIPLSAPRRKRRPVELVPSTETDPDRRFTRRVQLDVDIGWASETNFYVGFAEDVGRGGIFVATYDVLPAGTRVSISLVLPGGYQLSTDGRVTWTRAPKPDDDETQPGMGIAFEQLTDRDRVELEAFCAQRPPLFFDV